MRPWPVLLALLAGAAPAPDPLPSWNEGETKRALLDFVGRVAREGGPDHVPPAERIAVFDNDGTLWSETPAYAQLAFALDRLKALAKDRPEWKSKEPFRSALAGGLGSLDQRAILELVAATHGNTTAEEFQGLVRDWLETARHPRYGRPYTECVYGPMRELLDLLRSKGFKVFIVSGGGVEFLRAFSEKVYGVPPENVVGSSVKTVYGTRDGRPAILRKAEVEFVDDGPGKPVGIHRFIGRRPIAAFGNSDGDFEMLEWTTSGPGPRFGMIVHHDDAEREAAYDRTSRVGRLDRALDAAPARGWALASVRRDWKTVFPR